MTLSDQDSLIVYCDKDGREWVALSDYDALWNLHQNTALDDYVARAERAEAERDRLERELADLRTRLRNIRAELSHGVTCNWEYVDREFSRALEQTGRTSEGGDDACDARR